jgi:hypothetical protein
VRRRLGLLLFALALVAFNPTSFAEPTCQTCPEEGDGGDVDNPSPCQGEPLQWEFLSEERKGDWEGRKWAESNGEICFHYTETFTEFYREFRQVNGICPDDVHGETVSDFAGIWERRAYGDAGACCAAFGCD